jgi:hypothetical protein
MIRGTKPPALTALAAATNRYTLNSWLRAHPVNAPDGEAFEQTQSDYRAIRSPEPVVDQPWPVFRTVRNSVNGEGAGTRSRNHRRAAARWRSKRRAQALSGLPPPLTCGCSRTISTPDSRTSITAQTLRPGHLVVR